MELGRFGHGGFLSRKFRLVLQSEEDEGIFFHNRLNGPLNGVSGALSKGFNICFILKFSNSHI